MSLCIVVQIKEKLLANQERNSVDGSPTNVDQRYAEPAAERMTEVIRNKWCDDLEDLLQCPVCMNRPKENIYQCIEGHHICENCKSELATCPACKNRWSSARLRLVEHLCTLLDDIKLSLIHPEAEINKILLTNRVNVASQTEESRPPMEAHTGTYPCRVTGCTVNLDYSPMIEHIRNDHSTLYTELSMADKTYFQRDWPIEFVEHLTFDRVFFIDGTGTFFLKISSDIFGNISGFVMMLHNDYVVNKFMCHLELACCAEHPGVNYTGKVSSCRKSMKDLRDTCLHVDCTDVTKMLEHKTTLACTLLLCRE